MSDVDRTRKLLHDSRDIFLLDSERFSIYKDELEWYKHANANVHEYNHFSTNWVEKKSEIKPKPSQDVPETHENGVGSITSRGLHQHFFLFPSCH